MTATTKEKKILHHPRIERGIWAVCHWDVDDLEKQKTLQSEKV